MLAARVCGCTTIIAVDLFDERLELAKELGATHCVKGDDPDIKKKLKEWSDGGLDYCVDTTANPNVRLAIVPESVLSAYALPTATGVEGCLRISKTKGNCWNDWRPQMGINSSSGLGSLAQWPCCERNHSGRFRTGFLLQC